MIKDDILRHIDIKINIVAQQLHYHLTLTERNGQQTQAHSKLSISTP